GGMLYPGRERRRLLLMLEPLRFYVDDGGKDQSKRGRGGTPFLAAAGYVGSEEDWTALETEWPGILGDKVLHTTDVINGTRDFQDLKQPQRRRLLSLATNAVNKHTLAGVGFHIPVASFHATPGLDRMLVDDTPLGRVRGFAF